MPEDFRIIGSGRHSPGSDDEFRQQIREALRAARPRRARRPLGRVRRQAQLRGLQRARTVRTWPRRSRRPSRRSARTASASCTCRSRPERCADMVRMLGQTGIAEHCSLVVEKPFGHDLAQRPRAQRRAARGPRRGVDLPDRPLPRQGGGAEHPRAALRQRPARADLEPRPHRLRADRRARGDRHRGPRRASTRRPAPSATWSSPTCCRSSASWPSSRRRGSTPSRCTSSAPRSSTRCARSTPSASCSASTRATATRTAWPTTRAARPSPRSRSASTAGAGAACRSTCAPARRWPRAAGR